MFKGKRLNCDVAGLKHYVEYLIVDLCSDINISYVVY